MAKEKSPLLKSKKNIFLFCFLAHSNQLSLFFMINNHFGPLDVASFNALKSVILINFQIIIIDLNRIQIVTISDRIKIEDAY